MPAPQFKFPTKRPMFDPYTVRVHHNVSFTIDEGEPEEYMLKTDLTDHLSEWIEDITKVMSNLDLCTDYRLAMAIKDGAPMGFATVRFADPRMKNFFGLGDSDPCVASNEARADNGSLLPESVYDEYNLTEEQIKGLGEVFDRYAIDSPIGSFGVHNLGFCPVKDRNTGARLSDNQLEFSFTHPIEETDPKTGKLRVIKTPPTADEQAQLTRYINRLLSPLSTMPNFPRVASGRKGLVTAAFHPATLDAHSARALYTRLEVTLPGNPKVFTGYCSHSRR